MASHEFSGNYMILDPEKVSLIDLFGILFFRDLARKAFVNCHEDYEEKTLGPRWLIFVSLLVQKILKAMEKHLAKLGFMLEQKLSALQSCNTNGNNFFTNLLHVLRGKVEMPEKSSAAYLSMVGLLDTRRELDRSIKDGDCRYYGALSAMAAKIAYENEAFIKDTVEGFWEMKLIGCYSFSNEFEDNHRTTQAFMLHDTKASPDIIVVAFRGTEIFNAEDWCTDYDISWFQHPVMGKVHGGFMKALGLQKKNGWPRPDKIKEDKTQEFAYYTLRKELLKQMKPNSRTRFILTGHSLGGALAILFPAILSLQREEFLLNRLEGVYTFGQPRVGDAEFGLFMEKQSKYYGFKYFRFVYSNDLVPRLPPADSTFSFKHFGTCLYFNSCFKGQILEEVPYKNYLSLLAIIPRHLNAVWELIRSFILPYAKGKQYSENCILKVVRVFGILFPGFVAHNPQDYVNASRLASPSLYLPGGRNPNM